MNTVFLLMAEYGTAEIPLLDICEKYFGLGERKALEKAGSQSLPVPTYRAGSQKSQWLVSAQDLASYLDSEKEKARKDWKRIHAA